MAADPVGSPRLATVQVSPMQATGRILVLAFGVLSTHVALNVGVALCFLMIGAMPPLWAILWLSVVTTPLSFEVAAVLLACFLAPQDPPHLKHIASRPRVALLYLVCDDFDPDAYAS